ncbi:spore coat U domain-containing protein (plasmid) [Deinococcus taeanensis]|uniref:Csu type fimbrial protein n=1 Tax=Deinococcus taeanensis TaxID=2737050 RepID=UPI001CDCF68B|nr:spore coat protein U domain-containing protein [Deinococcus taeanensis]UBV44469.1 spore coat U domain-containing protein [Deinococcus taeanensis]
MKNMKIVAALGLMAGTMALAATTPSSTLSVSTTVNKTCSISTAPTALAFSNYDVYATAATTGTSTFGVKCSKGTAYTMKLSGGDTSGVRAFSGPGTLKYSLAYSTTPWGDGATGHAAPVDMTSAGMAEATYTINGSIAAGQDATQGSYTDTVYLTVDY